MSEYLERRGSIFVETASVIWQRRYAAEQFVLRVSAPECARRARPGSFAHISCSSARPMRRPLSIMSADADTGVVEFLYKVVGSGLRDLTTAGIGDKISLIGPVGNGFSAIENRPQPVLIGGGVGIPPIVFLARVLAAKGLSPLALMGSEVPFPFDLETDAASREHLPNTQTMAALEHAGIASRLASASGLPGTYEGHVTDLAAEWLAALPDQALRDVQLFACGPEPMLAATARLAERYELPCQLCLEEYMACAVGGCAGCAVPIMTPDGLAMQRVCVDGPVFEAASVYF
jgi:dihydroorotate dehydrogenase electron transfer subunit